MIRLDFWPVIITRNSFRANSIKSTWRSSCSQGSRKSFLTGLANKIEFRWKTRIFSSKKRKKSSDKSRRRSRSPRRSRHRRSRSRSRERRRRSRSRSRERKSPKRELNLFMDLLCQRPPREEKTKKVMKNTSPNSQSTSPNHKVCLVFSGFGETEFQATQEKKNTVLQRNSRPRKKLRD